MQILYNTEVSFALHSDSFHINNDHFVLLFDFVVLLLGFLHNFYVVFQSAFHFLVNNFGPIVDLGEPVIERILQQTLRF